MYLKKFEYFILDSSVAGTLLLIALAIRIEAVNAGFDQFSSNIIFISVFIISTGFIIRKTTRTIFQNETVRFSSDCQNEMVRFELKFNSIETVFDYRFNAIKF